MKDDDPIGSSENTSSVIDVQVVGRGNTPSDNMENYVTTKAEEPFDDEEMREQMKNSQSVKILKRV